MDVFLSDDRFFFSFWFARQCFGGSGLHLPSVFGFDESFQVAQARTPEAAVLFDPGVDGSQWFGVELINAVAPFPMFAHQVGTSEKTKMLGDGRAGDREGLGNLSGGLAAPAEKVENGAPGRIGKGLECSFRVSRRQICNRTVTHNA
jgi:hypothetical protein